MANELKKTPLEYAQEDYEVAIKMANDALNKKPIAYEDYNEAMRKLDAAEKAYALASANKMYDEYETKNNPIIEIIKAYAYKIIGHKEVYDKDKNNKHLVSIERIEKERPIDLLAFCKRANLDTSWEYTASKANQLICLRLAKDLDADLDKVAKTYFLQNAVKKIEMGGTPTSRTQVCKLLQQVINEMIPNEDEDGNLIYKVYNRDVKYLDSLYGKKNNKERITIKVCNDSYFRRLLLDIIYSIITNDRYRVSGYKEIK